MEASTAIPRKSVPPDLATALALDAFALALFAFHDLPAGLYSEAPGAFYVFIAASVALGCAMARSRAKAHLRVEAALWLFLFLMLTYQFGLSTGCRTLLLLGFLCQLALREAFPLNLALCLVSVASACLVYLAAAIDASGPGAPPSAEALASLAVFAATLAFAACALCALSRHRESSRRYGVENRDLKEVMRRLAETQLGYLEFARKAEERSSLNERNRLSAELHDTIGYTLTNLEMILEAGADLVDGDREKLGDLLATGLDQVRRSMRETRQALYVVRRESSGDTMFLNAVHKLAAVFSKTTGMKVLIDYGAFPSRCGEEAESAFYHFIQEGLVNAFSHGKAKEVKVYLSLEEADLKVSVIDDGIGAKEIVEGIGILGMRERFGKLGGTLSIETAIDGFRIAATVPANG